MSHQFLLPDLGEGLTEAEIVSWLVSPGDLIVIDQPVVEVESAKSIVELPSPWGGIVGELHAAAGETVLLGSALLTVLSDAESSAESVSGSPAAAPVGATPAPELVPGTALRTATSPAATGSGAVLVGYGTTESTMRLQRPAGGRFGRRMPADSSAPVAAAPAAAAPAPSPAAAAPALPTAAAPVSAASAAPTATGLLDSSRRSPVASPLLRRRARECGFDASQLVGSGPGALVLRQDVESAIAALTAPDAAPASTAPAAPRVAPDQPVTAAVPVLGDLRIPITGMRKVIGSRLAHSRRVIPEATIWLDVDATELFRAKDRLQQATGERFSLMTLIARFVVAGLAKYPLLNSSIDEDAGEIVQHSSINLGLAAQTPRGLMVPVLHGAGTLTTRGLRDGIAELVATAATGDYPASALRGGTFTLNNYGGFGVDGSAAIINHPEVAMLGVGRIIDRPWVVNGELAVRKVVVLSFVFDHRVCDGDVASGFLTYVAGCIEQPLLLLGDA